VNWKGWAAAIIALIVVAYLMFASGTLMQGDCIDIEAAPPC